MFILSIEYKTHLNNLINVKNNLFLHELCKRNVFDVIPIYADVFVPIHCMNSNFLFVISEYISPNNKLLLLWLTIVTI